MVRAHCGAPRHPAFRHQLRLGFDEQCAPGFRRRAACGDLRLFSAGLSAGRRGVARTRSRARGDRALAGRERQRMLPAGRPSAASARPARRRASCRAQYADRVWRFRAVALPHIHHRTLCAIPHRTRRPRELAHRACSRRALPCAGVCGIPGARRCALRPRRGGSEAHERAGGPWLVALAGPWRARLRWWPRRSASRSG